MVQSPFWEANWFAPSQEIPRISRNPKVHYRTLLTYLLAYLLTYLITHFMEESPSWEADPFSTSKKFPRIL